MGYPSCLAPQYMQNTLSASRVLPQEGQVFLPFSPTGGTAAGAGVLGIDEGAANWASPARRGCSYRRGSHP